jgi:hypothetical protein
MNTNTSSSTQTIPASRTRELLRYGTAVPLLENHFPVPVPMDGKWWIIPVDTTAHDFVRASPEQSVGFELAAQRLRAARPPASRTQA